MSTGILDTNTIQKQQISGIPASFVLNVDSVQNTLGAAFAEIVHNVAILHLSQNYLKLYTDLDKETVARLNSNHLQAQVPHDFEAVENGLDVLCAAYIQAKQSHNETIQKDIQKNIFSLSSLYQEKVSEAYFSTSNIVFDTSSLADNPDLLKQLVVWRNELQQVNFLWPMGKETANMPLFYEKVDFYGRSLGIEGQILPEKKSSFNSVFPHSFTEHSRCA